MPFQVSPGIVVTEHDLSIRVDGLGTYVGGFVGTFRWGPCNQIMTIDSVETLVRRVGRPTDAVFRDFFVSASFLSYANHLKLVRVVGDEARNAASGGVGSGLKLAVNTVNGVVSSVSVDASNKGTGYIAGDVVKIAGTVSDAHVRVTSTNPVDGSVQTVELVTAGSGVASGSSVATSNLGGVLVYNDEDLEDDFISNEVIARYPGAMGNSLIWSAARASEYDNWEYKDRFAVAPAATVTKWSGDSSTPLKLFTLPASYGGVLPSDAVVTVDGIRRFQGTGPGQFQFAAGAIVFNTTTENFVGNGTTYKFTLANANNLDASQAVVKIDGNVVPHYTGSALVPPLGTVRIVGNNVEFGIGRAGFNGDGLTTVFTINGVSGIANQAIVTVDGVSLTVIGTGAPTTGKVLVKDAGADTTLTFASPPAAGLGNVSVLWGVPAASARITVEYGFPNTGTDNVKLFSNQTEIHAVVVDRTGEFVDTREPNSLLERYEFLSLTPGERFWDGTSIYYKDVINSRSQYVRIPNAIYSWGTKNLTGGVDANDEATQVTSGVRILGYDLLRDEEEVEVYHIIGSAGDAAVDNHIIANITEARKDCVGYFSPAMNSVINNKDREADAVVADRQRLPSTSYGHMSSNWAYVYDSYNDKYRWIPDNGFCAGIYSQTHELYDPWWSGAGLNRGRLKNVAKLAWNPRKPFRDFLYANNVNPVYWMRGEGPVLLGDKTLQTKPSAFDRMNVRWLFIVLEKTIAKAARYFLFEFNDETTRSQFRNMVSPFLRDVKGRRGIQDFLVVCSEANNPGSVRDRNEFVGDIYVKPARSINYIALNFFAVGSDVNFNEIANSTPPSQ